MDRTAEISATERGDGGRPTIDYDPIGRHFQNMRMKYNIRITEIA